jgi:hypothetical protein
MQQRKSLLKIINSNCRYVKKLNKTDGRYMREKTDGRYMREKTER